MPDIDKLPISIKEKYNWIPKISITFMEFLHGFLRSKNKNACVFIRSKESLKGLPNEFDEKFFEKDPYSIAQLQVIFYNISKIKKNNLYINIMNIK